MKRLLLNLFIALALLVPVAAQAQGKTQGKKKTTRVVEVQPTVVSEANSPASSLNRVEIVKAAEVYKTSLRQLLISREAAATQADERIVKLKELYKDGLISRLQLESAEQELAEARHKVAETRKQLASTDTAVVETIAESDTTPVTEFEALPKSRAALKKVAYIRFKGSVDWSASEIGKIDEFFQAAFKRALPVASVGQSEMHNKVGNDHSDAVDVGVHPDSREGRALMTYLSSKGIPFMAFRRAVPGSAIGPHIHIGKASQKSILGVR